MGRILNRMFSFIAALMDRNNMKIEDLLRWALVCFLVGLFANWRIPTVAGAFVLLIFLGVFVFFATWKMIQISYLAIRKNTVGGYCLEAS